MKRLVVGFIIGLVVGAIGYRYLGNYTQSDLKTAAGKVKNSIQDTISEIRVEDIKQELARSSMVVREKARKAGAVLADATADARITAAIKAKYLKQPGLESLKIHVETTDGLVTLSGSASSHQEIATAIRLALETDGVHKVVSTLQVKPGS